ncbi:MAG: proteasome accessory factor PafA2 family protein [Abitibacteriaceae bacterium]|nr:proteasome accessory factor PafA2 family protein [Abditibacteriaceae bacterium]MBV9865101.1 proteasome accessory factor PafA2 family protein [Abditibacteriaceae bacterium]
MNSLFGIETEYGVTVEGADATGLVAASREVVQSYSGRSAGPWNYRAEDPRNDVRGFHVDKLSQDPTDAQFDKPGDKVASPTEDRCDRVLLNGARLYNDHGHPEYSTPECSSLRALVAHDKAGERIILECANAYAAKTGKATQIFKNNTDFHGASYGTHESYLMQRGVAWDDVIYNLAPFLATRIIYAGAGKVGIEERGAPSCSYQLSQRADFFSVLQSVDTLHNRPLVNTRDEAHGDARRFRRLHVIAGDANLSEYATALRVGATNLVVALIESGWETPVTLRDAVRSIKQISRDQTYRWLVEGSDGNHISAVDVQRAYWRAACKLELPGSEWLLDEWQATLDALAEDPWQLGDRLDWVAKKLLLDEFAEAEGLDWEQDALTLQSLDLAYHNVDPAEGLYYGLVESGAMLTLVTEEEIEAARCAPPSDTRAALRGLLVRRFADTIKSASWGGLVVEEAGERINLVLPEAAADYPALCQQIETAASAHDVAAILRKA